MIYEEIETFLQIHESGNIGKAAKQLNITQGTASVRIKQLEQELNIKLFYRHQGIKNIELTAEGKLFLPIAQMSYALWNDAKNINNLKIFQNLKIASSDTINMSTLYDAYDQFIKEYDDINLSVKSYHSKEIHRLIENQFCDIGFCTNIYNFTNVLSTHIYEEDILLVIHKNHPYLKTKKILDLTFGTEIYVNYSSSFNLWHKQKFERYEHKLFTVGTVSMQISFLNDKSRWAFTPADFALNFVKNNPEYVAIKTDLNPPMRTIYLLHNKYPKAGTRNIIFLFLDILYNILKNNDAIHLVNQKPILLTK